MHGNNTLFTLDFGRDQKEYSVNGGCHCNYITATFVIMFSYSS